jgi:hypothetical protein
LHCDREGALSRAPSLKGSVGADRYGVNEGPTLGRREARQSMCATGVHPLNRRARFVLPNDDYTPAAIFIWDKTAWRTADAIEHRYECRRIIPPGSFCSFSGMLISDNQSERNISDGLNKIICGRFNLICVSAALHIGECT